MFYEYLLLDRKKKLGKHTFQVPGSKVSANESILQFESPDDQITYGHNRGAHLVERQDNSGTTVIINTLLDTVTLSAGTTIVTSTVTANPVTITTTTATAGITSSETTGVEVSGAVLFRQLSKADVWCLVCLLG
jgi:hypothetical protein